jgi:hypothetical protein
MEATFQSRTRGNAQQQQVKVVCGEGAIEGYLAKASLDRNPMAL